MRTILAAAVLFGITACGSSTEPRLPRTVELEFTFDSGGWQAGFTDYPVGTETQHELDASTQFLPAPLDTFASALMLSGVNHSDDLFMYARRVITNLTPSAEYEVAFRVRFASNAPSGCAGVGGAPGESVVIKAGASAEQPVPVEQNGDYRLSVDKGEQMQEGSAALVLGDVATQSTSCNGDAPWVFKTLDSGDRTLTARADADGRLWVFVGVESGFEGRTRIYLDRIVVAFERVD